jgi:hypothetical protein
MMTGYEQVRSIVAEIAGDHEAARQVRLVLPGLLMLAWSLTQNYDGVLAVGSAPRAPVAKVV